MSKNKETITQSQLDDLTQKGFALHQEGKLNAAETIYLEVLNKQDDHFACLYLLGGLLVQSRRYQQALEYLYKALKIRPDDLGSLINCGVANQELGYLDNALFNYDRAIAIDPYYPGSHYNRGNVLKELGRLDEALQSCNKAIYINPNYASAHFNRGNVLKELGRIEDALQCFAEALRLNPEIDYLLGGFIEAKMALCDWSNIYDLINQLKIKIKKNELATIPFTTLVVTDDLELQKQSAQIYVGIKYPQKNILPPISKYQKNEKIRIGYFSADFREHAVSYLMAELFELHNRNQYEIIAFSYSDSICAQDNLRKRIEKAFDQFIDVREKSDLEITLLARELEIEIAIDLGGHTAGARTNIFSMRAAPIQVSYLGYLGTMGADYYDYLIADSSVIPQDYQQFYSEKIVYLPSYQVNDNKREVSDKKFTKSEFGLPDNGFVFCCFNNTYKITPKTFDSWMRILNAVEGSVLLLLDTNQTATNNLRKEAIAKGVGSDRLIFGKVLPAPEYLARYHLADLFLDTFPYNAGTTASDALRMGLPVLTQTGKSFSSRIAASLLSAVGITDLISTSTESYELLAIELGRNPERLKRIRSRLVSYLPTTHLYNTKLFTQNIELAYQKMYDRYRNDLKPDHLYIDK